VALAEQLNGAIPRPVDFSYAWGDARAELDRVKPQTRIINVEISITTGREYAPKGINCKRNLANIGCLILAGVDCCALANLSFSNAKSWLNGTFHGVSKKHLPRYACEWNYRFNRHHRIPDLAPFVLRHAANRSTTTRRQVVAGAALTGTSPASTG
jgi:hypothetical protein